jgi:hypothetical protein
MATQRQTIGDQLGAAIRTLKARAVAALLAPRSDPNAPLSDGERESLFGKMWKAIGAGLAPVSPDGSIVIGTRNDADGVPQLSLQASAGISRLKRTIYDTAGAFYHDFESGTHTAIVETVGGGGGGGGAGGGSSAGAGAGGGAYISVSLQVNGGSISGTVGAGGSAGSSAGGNGADGGTTTATYNGVTYTAGGGLGGAGMPAGSSASVVPEGGGGTPGTTGDIRSPGHGGMPGIRMSTTLFVSGWGGGSVFGGGNGSTGTPGDGGPGRAIGCGGGGGAANATGYAGGAGHAGGVVITEFLPTGVVFAGGSLADEDDYPVTIVDGVISGFGTHRKLLVSGTGTLVGIDAPDMAYGSLLLTFVADTVITAMGAPASGLPIKTPRMGADDSIDIHLKADDVVEVRRRSSDFWKVTGGSFT